jgi:hypothetical protein
MHAPSALRTNEAAPAPILENFRAEDAEVWGRQTLKLRHRLHLHPLFSDQGLASLLDTLPPARIAINTMAAGGHHLESWSYCRPGNFRGHEILDLAKRGRIWINMTRLHEYDPRCRDLMDQIFRELTADMPEFRTFKHALGLLISSPGAQVFYHADPPGQSLWQLRGRKRIYIYPAEEPFLRPADVENIVRGCTEEEIPYQSWFDRYASVHELEAGDMLHWKLNGPHRVVNGDSLNVSITTEHWTNDIRRSYAMNYGNGVLRRIFGWTPRSRAITGPAFWGKVALTAACRASRVHRRTSFRRSYRYVLDRNAPSGLAPISPSPAE